MDIHQNQECERKKWKIPHIQIYYLRKITLGWMSNQKVRSPKLHQNAEGCQKVMLEELAAGGAGTAGEM